jgi:pimeloyl-ACP methyl ester carboxylesterase
MPYAAVNDLQLYYEEHGIPSSPPLVLLHGFMGTGDVWRQQLEPFSTRYRLIVPDGRGCGRTGNPGGLPRMNYRQFARDVIALCGTLGLVRPIFCGVSSGAMQLLSLALAAPDLARALVLTACTHFYADELRAWWSEQTPESIVPPERRPAMQASHTVLGTDHWRLVAAAYIALGQHAHADDFPEKDELRGIRTPTLIVHGDRDPSFPIEIPLELYRLLPDAELCLLPRTGHGPHRERPEWFNAIVLDFLARRAI